MASGAPKKLSAAELATRRRNRRIVIFSLVGLLFIFIALNINARGHVPKGTSVEGVAIGGLSPDQAKKVLKDKLEPRLLRDVIITDGERQSRVDLQEAAVGLDLQATVDSATSLTGGNSLTRLFGKGGAVDPVFAVRETFLNKSINAVVKKLSHPVVEGGLAFSGNKVTGIKPKSGQVLTPEQVKVAIFSTAAARQRKVKVSLTSQQPQLTAEDVANAVSQLGKTVVSAPISIRLTGTGANPNEPVDQSIDVPIATLTPSFSTKVVDGKMQLVVDGPRALKAIQQDLGPTQQPAVDARFRIVKGKPTIVPSQDGQAVDVEQLSSAIAEAATQEGIRLANVTLKPQAATFTTADAKKLGIVEQISKFRQKFPYAPYRYQNIGQAAERINGTLLKPGEVFSMNNIVLERTPANGYTKGFVIKSGRLQEDLGGGVSTMATATWHAAFFAGLERIEQRAHSFYISRYQPGLEATVSWGQLDLKFRNDSPHGVFITAVRGTNFVTVTMYGTKRYDISAESGPHQDVKPFTQQTDASSPCTPQGGSEGFTIVVTRVFKIAGKEVKREPLTTKYNPAANITCKKPTPKATATPTASAKPAAKPTPQPTG